MIRIVALFLLERILVLNSQIHFILHSPYVLVIVLILIHLRLIEYNLWALVDKVHVDLINRISFPSEMNKLRNSFTLVIGFWTRWHVDCLLLHLFRSWLFFKLVFNRSLQNCPVCLLLDDVSRLHIAQQVLFLRN